jgi:NADP-dependent 3-hydroxy acid dehydrogenase YdfG
MIVTLENKTILITGASSGIGRQVAIHCYEAGANLILTGRDESKLKETCSLLKKGKHISLAGDLTDENFISSLCEMIGNIDGIVHSAGIIYPLPTKFIRKKHPDEVMNINYYSPVLLTSKLLK